VVGKFVERFQIPAPSVLSHPGTRLCVCMTNRRRTEAEPEQLQVINGYVKVDSLACCTLLLPLNAGPHPRRPAVASAAGFQGGCFP
jgi:hypothetical protein